MNTQIWRAIDFAIRKHDGQWRKGGDGPPYVVHCIDVAKRLLEVELDDTDSLCAAVLHDVIEDTAVSPGEIEHLFGSRVRAMVVELTLPEEVQRDYAQKREHQVAAMVNTTFESVRAIKVADKTSNVVDLIHHPPKWGLRAMLGYIEDAGVVVRAAQEHTALSAVRELSETFRKHAAEAESSLRSRRAT